MSKVRVERVNEGQVVAVCISRERGTAKENVGEGFFEENCGLRGDAHAGTSRQVSLLMAESVLRVAQEAGVPAQAGDFAENILTRGIDLRGLRPGDRLQVGEGILEVVQIGKEVKPHHYSFHGLRLLPSEGVFGRVVRGGRVRVGDPVRVLP
ncbi:MOSC domain-containing protein [Thermodesulfitimonas autotrophica]|uniref:MOSC domain-containing protein n=1 Tax=Thermodesulfitimonas autotrophica TaxID=1894989 RepID=UPI002FE39842